MELNHRASVKEFYVDIQKNQKSHVELVSNKLDMVLRVVSPWIVIRRV